MITGPLAGQMLADMGADVIKIERPDGGDPFRTFRDGEVSPYFQAYNRNKRSVAADLQTDVGKLICRRLIASADVFIENFRPGVMAKLGLGAAEMRTVNPRLVYCSISGFGSFGPYRDRPAYDAVAQALSGLSGLFLDQNLQITGPTIADNLTGIYACYGILSALYEREQTGAGRVLEVNMLDSAVAFMPDAFASYSLSRCVPGPFTRVQASQSYALSCADGKMIAIHLSSQLKFWESLCAALDRADLLTDSRFDTRAKRIDRYFDLKSEFQRAVRSRSQHDWLARLTAFDVPHAPINNLDEVLGDAQVQALDSFAAIALSPSVTLTVPRRPVWIDGSRNDQPMSVAPALNQDGERVIATLGLTEDELARWRGSQVQKGSA